MAWPSSSDVDTTKFDQDSDRISDSRPELLKIAGYVNDIIDAGPIGNSFSTISANGTSLVADSTSDTLTVVAGTGIIITGDAGTDTLTITSNVITPNAFSTISANGTSVVADSTTDTVTFVAGNNISIIGNAATDTITFSTLSPGDVVLDTTPQLGGNLDTNGFNIFNSTITDAGLVKFNDGIKVTGPSSFDATTTLNSAVVEGTLEINTSTPGNTYGITMEIDGVTGINMVGTGSELAMAVANVALTASGARTLGGYIQIKVDNVVRHIPYYL